MLEKSQARVLALVSVFILSLVFISIAWRVSIKRKVKDILYGADVLYSVELEIDDLKDISGDGLIVYEYSSDILVFKTDGRYVITLEANRKHLSIMVADKKTGEAYEMLFELERDFRKSLDLFKKSTSKQIFKIVKELY